VASHKKPSLDPVAWARSQRSTIGRPCTLCLSHALGKWVRLAVEEWASGRTAINGMSWPKVAAGLRATYGTKTVWESVRRHVREHEPHLWDKLQKHLGE